MTPLESHFLTILQAHRGLANAISVPQLAAELGVPQRTAQEVKKGLIEHHGVLIGSNCKRGASGWYIPKTPSEIEATMGQYRSRVRSLCVLIAKTTAAANLSGVLRQLALEFEEEEIAHARDYQL